MEDRQTRTDGAKKRHSESGGGLLRFWGAGKQTGRLPGFPGSLLVCGRVGARLHVVSVQSCGVNDLHFNALPMLGRVSSETVQGWEGNRTSAKQTGAESA
jgi:hypothetical protein